MTRRTDIDMAKGLAILLVVFGHLVARTDPAGVGWYEPLRRAVYGFHMPLFFYLAGLVYALRPGFLGKRAVRLLVPFFGLGVLEVLCKLVAARVMFVDNAPAGLAPGLADLVWHTAASPALSIWFLFVLFVYCAAGGWCFWGWARHCTWCRCRLIFTWTGLADSRCFSRSGCVRGQRGSAGWGLWIGSGLGAWQDFLLF